jgi:hypothetical protein
MSKSYTIIIIILVAFLLAVWSPWNSWNLSITRLLGIEPPEEIGGLEVSSLAGTLEVYVDGNLKGTVDPEKSPLIIPAVEPGERQIKLIRKSDVEGAYYQFNKLVKFESGVDVILAYELGPTAEFSEGHIIYATKTAKVSNPEVSLNLTSSADDSEVKIDDLDIGQTPIVAYKLDLTKQHKLLISKNGYESQEFIILPAEQKDRDKLKGYNLNVDVDLFLQPIAVK